MTQLRLVPYRRLRRVVEAAGFQWARCEGSHNIFRDQRGRIVVIPDHGARPIGRGLLQKILRQIELTAEEYERILDEI
jgi:predicted RNA binding protein YcfA (HicA-like mRNA interferase family)